MVFLKKFLIVLCGYLTVMISIDVLCGILYLVHVITILRCIALLYLVNFLVIPVLQIAIGMYQIIKRKRNKYLDGTIRCVLSTCLLGIFVYASLIEPTRLQIEEKTISSQKVTDDITLIHISDIQTNSIGTYEEEVFTLLEALPADIILHTGDLVQPFYYTGYDVSQYEPLLKDLSRLFQKLHPTYGVYNVIGDTELEHKIPVFDRLSGVKTLVDEHLSISTDRGRLNILGLSLETSRNGDSPLIRQWLEEGRNDEFNIVMGHAPDYIPNVLGSEIDLCLAGHTHGGQVYLPVIGALLASSTIPKSWVRGFKTVRSTHFNVSSGIGVSHAWGLPPIRFRCPPTITMITIQALKGREE